MPQSRRERKKKFTLKKLFYTKKKADVMIVGLTFALTFFGLLMVYNASVIEAFRDFNDKFYYLKLQLIWALVGFIGLGIFSHLDYHLLKKAALPLFIANLILLILVLIPGIGLKTKGARRWFDFGPFTFQPTESLKTTLSLYFATWLSQKRPFLPFLLLIVVILGLIVAQPDLGTAIVIVGASFLIYYVSGAKVLPFLGISFLAFLLGVSLILVSPYRKARLLTFFDPTQDPLGSSYHIRQVLLALGSGGIWGRGLGQSRQKYQYLPEATADSIFAVVAEEVGFLGGSVLIFTFLFLIWRGLYIAQRAPDIFGRLLATGITSWLTLQIFVNLAAMVALIPLTGVPLPFISYGGSSLIITLVSMGILLNISRQG